MKKKILATILISALALSITACGSGSETDTTTVSVTDSNENTDSISTSSEAEEETPETATVKPLDLTGDWYVYEEEDIEFEAKITDDTITVNTILFDGASTWVYWIGSYTAPTDDTSEYTWTSQRNSSMDDEEDTELEYSGGCVKSFL